LGTACREVGFFYVTGHGVPRSLLEGVFAAARDFFAQSSARKLDVSLKRSPHNRGYVSTPHRVTPPARDRYSIAFFLDPNPAAKMEVLPGCVAPGESAKYPPTTGADYLRSRLDATYDQRQAAARDGASDRR